VPTRPHDVYIICPPGLEPLTAAEVRKLGCKVPRLGHGGFSVNMTTAELYGANLHLRTASRVLLRLSRFEAEDKGAFLAGFRKISFDRYLRVDTGQPANLRVDSVASKLANAGIVERLAREVLGSLTGATVRIRLDHDTVTVSIDSSGDHLHRRGWREALARAPLRETLAAALVTASGYDGQRDAFVDPMCGSGTIAIEAARLARGLPAGAMRSFAFQTWPGFDAAAWARVNAKAASGAFDGPIRPIVGADRDTGAIEAAVANAQRAGVADDIEFRVAPISALAVPDGPGVIASNPPYGMRVSGGADLRDLYDAFGNVVRGLGREWRVALIAADRAMVTRVIAKPNEVATLDNGGIPVSIVTS
jgi:putative N6-adenine-specific DNA methylase